jgi:6-phosphogluconolactonase
MKLANFLFSISLILLSLAACNSKKASLSANPFVGGSGSAQEPPILGSVSPTSWGVNGGGTLAISGSNFTNISAVYVGGVAATQVSVQGGTLLSAILPPHHAEIVAVTVQNSQGQSGTLENAFSYNSFLYSANQATNNVTAFVIDSATGALTSAGTVSAPAGAYGAEVDPSNNFFYTAGVGASQIGAYSINAKTGSLTAITGSPFTAGSGVNGLVFSKNSSRLYASNFNANTINCFNVNTSTGSISMGGTIATAVNPGGITLDSSDQYLYVTNYGSASVSYYSVGAACAMSLLGTAATGGGPDGIALHPSGQYLVTGNANVDTVSIFARNTADGSLAALGTVPIPAAAGGSGVIFDTTGTHLYATSYGAGKVVAFSVNTATGALTSLGTVSAQAGTNDVRVQSLGRWVFTANTSSNSVSAFVRDIATGLLLPAATPNITVGNSPGIIAITDAVR